jgi:hypothetical protein
VGAEVSAADGEGVPRGGAAVGPLSGSGAVGACTVGIRSTGAPGATGAGRLDGESRAAPGPGRLSGAAAAGAGRLGGEPAVAVAAERLAASDRASVLGAGVTGGRMVSAGLTAGPAAVDDVAAGAGEAASVGGGEAGGVGHSSRASRMTLISSAAPPPIGQTTGRRADAVAPRVTRPVAVWGRRARSSLRSASRM